MPALTEEQQKDISERIEKFKEAHLKLVQDLQVDIHPTPVFTPVAPTAYGISLAMEYADLKYRTPSPLAGLK